MAFLDIESLSHERMVRLEDERRFRNLAILSICCFVLPVAAGLHGGVFVWDLLPTATMQEILRLTSPVFLGVGLLALSFSHKLDRLVSGLMALTLLVVSTIFFTESDLAYTDLFTGMIGYVGRRPFVVLMGLSLIAIGADLRNKATAGQLIEEEGSSATKRDSSLIVKMGNGALFSGAVLLVLLYGLPQRGRPLLMESLDLIGAVGKSEQIAEIMGVFFILIFQLVPIFVATWAVVSARKEGHVGLLASAARYSLSGLIVLFSYRLLQQGFHGDLMLMQLKAAALIAIFTGTVSVSIVSILEHLFHNPLPQSGQGASPLIRDQELRVRLLSSSDPSESTLKVAQLVSPTEGGRDVHPFLAYLMKRRMAELMSECGWSAEAELDQVKVRALLARLEGHSEDEDATGESSSPGRSEKVARWITSGSKRLVGCTALAVAVLFSLAWLNQHTPQPDLTWELREATEAEDSFFSWSLPRYVYNHSRRNALLGAEVGEDRIPDHLTEESVKADREEILEAAADLSPDLEAEVLELIDALDSVDVAGRRWYAAIRPINQRIRDEGLPFFLKGTYSEFVPEGEKKPVRMYFLGSYRVKDVQHYSFEGRRYGAIHATRDSLFYEAGLPLGYVHPDEPFALIMIDEVEDHVRTLIETISDEGSCGLSNINAGSIDAIDLDILCGKILKRSLLKEGFSLEEKEEEAVNELLKREIYATEIHEIQHQIDGNHIEIPGQLFRLIPIASDRQLSRAAYEISAYLTQLSLGDELTTASTLAALSTHLMTPGQVQTPYRYAAGIILSELTGTEIIRPMGRVRMLKLLEAWQMFADQGDDLPEWVSQRAAELHEELLGTPASIAELDD